MAPRLPNPTAYMPIWPQSSRAENTTSSTAGQSPQLNNGGSSSTSAFASSDAVVCPTPDKLIFDYSYRSDFGSSGRYSAYVFGPASSINDQMMAQMAEVYSVNDTGYYGGYSNGTQLKESLLLVDSLEEFTQQVQTAQNARSSEYSSGTWWDSSFTLPSFGRRKFQHDSESTEMQSADLMEELKHLSSRSADLRVETVSRSFKMNATVDNVTFAVKPSEIFTLLGPNGAGKSMCWQS